MCKLAAKFNNTVKAKSLRNKRKELHISETIINLQVIYNSSLISLPARGCSPSASKRTTRNRY